MKRDKATTAGILVGAIAAGVLALVLTSTEGPGRWQICAVAAGTLAAGVAVALTRRRSLAGVAGVLTPLTIVVAGWLADPIGPPHGKGGVTSNEFDFAVALLALTVLAIPTTLLCLFIAGRRRPG